MKARQMLALPVAMTFAAGAMVMFAGSATADKRPSKGASKRISQPQNNFRAPGQANAGNGDEGGIAAITYFENFETGFTAGSGCGQNGWTGYCASPDGLQFQPSGVSGFGAMSGRHNSDGSAVAGFEAISPIFTLGTGRLDADVIIADNSSLYQVVVVNVGAGYFNTRLNFETTGAINALSVDPACTTGTFSPTTGTWTPGVKFRIGVETNGTQLKVYKDNVLIYTGTDINSICAPAAPPGISQWEIYAANATNTQNMVFDNIGIQLSCQGDVNLDGQVNVADLLSVISTWGPCAGCPSDINGDGQVNVADLLTVISKWGVCTGACCVSGSCQTLTAAACATAGGTYQGNASTCATTVCPPAAPANDHIVGAIDITGNINGAAINNSNVSSTPARHNGVPANADPELPATSPSCQWNATPTDTWGTVWYKFTAPASGQVTLSLCSSVLPFSDSVMACFSGTPGALVEVACNDDAAGCSANGYSSTFTAFGLTPGNTYYVVVGNPGSWTGDSNGPFVLQITNP